MIKVNYIVFYTIKYKYLISQDFLECLNFKKLKKKKNKFQHLHNVQTL